METISRLFLWSFCLINNVYMGIFVKKNRFCFWISPPVFSTLSQRKPPFGWRRGEGMRGGFNIHCLLCQLFRHGGEGSCLHVNGVSTRPTIPSEIEGLGILHEVMNLLPGSRGGRGEQNLSSLTPRTLQPWYEQCPQHYQVRANPEINPSPLYTCLLCFLSLSPSLLPSPLCTLILPSLPSFSWYSTFKTVLEFLLSRAFAFIYTQKECFPQFAACLHNTGFPPTLFPSLSHPSIVPCPHYSKKYSFLSKSWMPISREVKNKLLTFNLLEVDSKHWKLPGRIIEWSSTMLFTLASNGLLYWFCNLWLSKSFAVLVLRIVPICLCQSRTVTLFHDRMGPL